MTTANRVVNSHATPVLPRFPPFATPATIITTNVSTYTVQSQDNIIIFTTSTGTITIDLPVNTDSAPGRILYFTLNNDQQLISSDNNVYQLDGTLGNAITTGGYADWRALVYDGNGSWYTFMQY